MRTVEQDAILTVKWYDPGLNYGFAVHDGKDVFIHRGDLRDASVKVLYDGARVHCDVVEGTDGPRVANIKSVDLTDAEHPDLQIEKYQIEIGDLPRSDWHLAQCKWYNQARGFGFLARGTGKRDAFVHAQSLRCNGLVGLWPGHLFEIQTVDAPRGPMAIKLRLPS